MRKSCWGAKGENGQEIGVQGEGAVFVGCKRGKCARGVGGANGGKRLGGVGVQGRWECVRDLGCKVCRESRGARVGKCPWNVGMHEDPGTGKALGRSPRCHPEIPAGSGALLPPDPSCSPGELCTISGAKVTSQRCSLDWEMPPVPSWPGTWIGSSPGQLFPPGALEFQCRREKSAGMGWCVHTRMGSGCLKRGWRVGFGADDAPADSGKVGSILEGYSLPLPCQFAAVGPSKEEGELGKAKLPVGMNHKMLQSLLPFTKGSLKA